MRFVERNRRWLLAAIVLFGLALRLVAIQKKLSSDDGYTWLVASAPDAHTFFQNLADYENTPPLFYLLLSLTPLDHEFWLRIPSLVGSVVSIGVIYAIVRPLMGTRAALLSALGLAVAPTTVELANYSRGFMWAEMGLLMAIWALVRLAQGRDRRWWLLYLFGALIALWSEYNSGAVLLVVGVILFVLGRPRRVELVGIGILPALTLIPWLGQLQRSLDQVNVTKWAGVPPDPSLGRFRDIVLSLSYGRILPSSFGAYADLRLVLILIVIAAAIAILWFFGPRLVAAGGADSDGPARGLADVRLGFYVFAGGAVCLFGLHWVLAAFGVNGVFVSKYLSTMVPLTVVVLACAVVALRWRWLAPAAAVACLLGGVALGVVRHRDAPTTQDVDAIHQLAEQIQPGTILTNSSEIVYYLRDFNTRLDRPFDLLPSQEDACAADAACPKPLLIVDQTAYPSLPRPGPGPKETVGIYVVRLHPTQGAPTTLAGK
jgi:hypothetical protein